MAIIQAISRENLNQIIQSPESMAKYQATNSGEIIEAIKV